MSEKYFRDTRIQIGILKSRGLTIRNKRIAKKLIRKINYYNLINGYKDVFLEEGTPYVHMMKDCIHTHPILVFMTTTILDIFVLIQIIIILLRWWLLKYYWIKNNIQNSI